MTRKPIGTGLAAFGTKPPEPEPTPAAPPPSLQATRDRPLGRPRKRAIGQTVAMTFRVTRSDWQRLHGLAVAEGVSLQALVHEGLTGVLEKHGLDGLEQYREPVQ